MKTHFYPPLHLDPTKRHEIALTRLETYNLIPNIDAGDNVMRYEIDDVNHDIINDVIRSMTDAFELTANSNTLNAIIHIKHSRI